jgi:hypothetical protein
MSLTKQYHNLPKCKRGPGGIHCPCCKPYMTKPQTRRLARRTYRQVLNQAAKVSAYKELNT